ncbi:nuclear transport factor 2 family protein [Streptomyces sp. NPDC059913]|uniref:nuclear transport factor 2 family protein n=1 Tax=unclassified Streptomyces TaxID=2593676 RepID=UPI003662CEB3
MGPVCVGHASAAWHLCEICACGRERCAAGRREYRALFPGHPAPDEPARTRRIGTVDVHGSVATATMTLHHGADTFTDVFLLVHGPDGEWRIANEAYHRHH